MIFQPFTTHLLAVIIYAGTRELWLKGQQAADVRRKVVEAENKLHTVAVSKIMYKNYFNCIFISPH